MKKIYLFLIVLFTTACSGSDTSARWDLNDPPLPDIVPNACQDGILAAENRPPVERLDEDSWALHFEPFIQDCAVYHSSIELFPDENYPGFGRYLHRMEVCNRCTDDQIIHAINHVGVAEEPPEMVEVNINLGFEGGIWSSALGIPLVGIGTQPKVEFIADCQRGYTGEHDGLIRPAGPFVSHIDLGHYPMPTDQFFRLASVSTLNAFIGAEMGDAETSFSSPLNLRIFWPKMLPATSPTNAMNASFKPETCKAHGWDFRAFGPLYMPPEYDWKAAYWSSPIQSFELPDELLERLP